MNQLSRAGRPRPSLRSLLQQDQIAVAPGAYDMLSALLIEQAGFSCLYMTGNGQSASALGLPDLGMMSLSEMAERVRRTVATVGLPVIVDGDDGYGNLLTLQRAVREFEASGAGAIQLEDQVSPKRCGHELGREVVPVEEMIARLRAATDARTSPDTLIIARTDARTGHGLGEAIRRGRIYAAHGADVVVGESPERRGGGATWGGRAVAGAAAGDREGDERWTSGGSGSSTGSRGWWGGSASEPRRRSSWWTSSRDSPTRATRSGPEWTPRCWPPAGCSTPDARREC